MKLTKVGSTIAIVLGMVVMVCGAKGVLMLQASEAKRPVVLGKTFGVVNAPVKIEEFTDFQCPACAAASMVLHEEIKKESSKIFLELKYFPLAMHAHARRAAVAAQCALAQNKFWPMQDMLFRTQKVWSLAKDPTDYFLSLARGVGLDDKKMMRCMSDQATELKIEEDVKEGNSRGVNATPTFFVNGKMVVGAPNFQAALKDALK